MENVRSWFATGAPKVVGSFGSVRDLLETTAEIARNSCDLAEVRLDLLGVGSADAASPWQHLRGGIPLLFTARRGDEGGVGGLSAAERMRLLEGALNDAALVDIEVASIGEMRPLVDALAERGIPWVASWHDFHRLPETRTLDEAAGRARAAGAVAFKAAAMMAAPADVARLAEFQLADHGISVSTMGMGALAPVSRLLCAQCGSVLNYGFLGQTTTAPGQWDAAALRAGIARLTAVRG